MRMFNAERVNRILRRVTAPFRCRVVILMYHRVYKTSSDPWELCVSPKHFAEQLELLRQHYPVLSLYQLAGSLRDSKLPKQGVVLTFDDGYADNFWNAKPLLEKYEVPATVFVTSGSVDASGFWWDDLERALLHSKKLPKCLQLHAQGRLYEWPTINVDQRRQAYMAIHKILKPLRASDRDQIMTELYALVDVKQTKNSNSRPLTTSELTQLAQSEFVDIGAHTVTHSSLPVMSPSDQSEEIIGSRQKLTAILGNRVDTFSYPYGNFTAETVEIVKLAGFEMALTCETNVVEKGPNQFQLGRFGVGDWEGEKFRRHLHEFFQG